MHLFFRLAVFSYTSCSPEILMSPEEKVLLYIYDKRCVLVKVKVMQNKAVVIQERMIFSCLYIAVARLIVFLIKLLRQSDWTGFEH